MKRLTEEKRTQIIELRKKGNTIEQVATKLGVSTSSVQRVVGKSAPVTTTRKRGRPPKSASVHFQSEVLRTLLAKAEAFDAITALVHKFSK